VKGNIVQIFNGQENKWKNRERRKIEEKDEKERNDWKEKQLLRRKKER